MFVVTGGAGFIGSCFLRKLNEEGITDILVVDKLGNELKWKNLLGKQISDVIHKTDFRKKLLAGDFGAEIEGIFHFGACSATTEKNADYLLENNFSYSKDLSEYAVNRNIRFVYASSAATYGDGKFGYSDEIYDVLCPLNMYGYSKHIFDIWVRKNGYDQRIVGVKFFNVFGPNEYHKGDMASVIYKAYRQVMETGKIRLFKSYHSEYADGEQMRDFIYVKDTLDVLWKMFCFGEINGIFNLGTGKARTWNDLATAIFSVIGKPLNIEYVEMPVELRAQYQYFTQANMTKLKNNRAFQPCRELEDSVSDYIQTHLNQQEQYF